MSQRRLSLPGRPHHILDFHEIAKETLDWLGQLSFHDFLTARLGPENSVLLRDHLTGSVHCGFILPPPRSLEGLIKDGRDAGFNGPTLVFESEVMAKELEARSGRPIPTQIVKWQQEKDDERVLGLEVFLPQATSLEIERWCKEKVGTHIGFGLDSEWAVWRAQELCHQAGFTTPCFLKGRPAINRAEEILVVYSDSQSIENPFRLEFYHAARE